MKQWVQKLIDQLDFDLPKDANKARPKVSEDRATLLYMIDVINKNLVDIDTHPIRRVREQLDGFAKELVNAEKVEAEKALFRFRQFFSGYRVAEYTYIRKTFEDFKGIIWNFVEQMSEDVQAEQKDDTEINTSLQALREAVEADSIDVLRAKSREFIQNYVEHHNKKEVRRTKRMKSARKSLDTVKKQLEEADRSMRMDHLTSAYNRKSFDERTKQAITFLQLEKTPCTLLLMDIDFFKKINDTYGHDVGDVVLKEFVRMMHEVFKNENDFVARIGGEEFAVLLSDYDASSAIKRAEDAMNKVRKEVLVNDGMELRFTMSMGIAQLGEGETADHWLKRADEALYKSKHSGRNQYTVASANLSSKVA